MANTKITASLLDPAQTNITSLGTLSALTISGNLTVDTSTLKVDSSNNRVGVGTASPQALFHAAATNTTVWHFTSAQSGTYSYTPYPHELVVDNDTTGNEVSFASVFFSAGADSDGTKIATARIGAVETGNYKEGLNLYKWRQNGKYAKNNYLNLDIKTIKDKKILITCDQGLGDTILLSRYVLLLLNYNFCK